MGLLSRLDRHADLVHRMAERLGIDLVEATQRGEVSEEALRSVVLTCTGCHQTGDCESWLAEHSGGANETPDYCRNKDLLNRLAVAQAAEN